MAHCVSCWGLPAKLNSLSLRNTPTSAFTPLSISFNTPALTFSRGVASAGPMQMTPKRVSIVCKVWTKEADSAKKRFRQSEKRRIYNKSKKSEFRTRMKKVFEALRILRKKRDAQPEDVLPIEKLIAEAYSAIDKAAKVRAIHRNTAARRKSRLARQKRAVQIHHGWYTPPPPPPPVAPTPTV